MSDNLKLWEQFEDIDPRFTKPITGKPYKGTSPNPHYVIKCLTEMFGPVGTGFGWEVVAEGFTPVGDELLHWCRIHFWHGDGKGFQAYGQTKAYMKTKSGFLSDEDAPKKSLTDAITKAAAQIGVGANIFLGRWDDSRYVEGVNTEFRERERAAAEPPFNAKAAADSIAADLNKAKTADELAHAWRARNMAIARLKAEAPHAFAMIEAAKNARKAVLDGDPAMQAPAGHAYQ